MKNKFYAYIQNLQDEIVAGLEAVDGQTKFREAPLYMELYELTKND